MYANMRLLVLFVISVLPVTVIQARVKRDIEQTTAAPLVIDVKKFQQHMDEFRSCVDKHLANVVGEVQVNQLQPVFDVVGDQVSRLTKAWDVLTAPKSTPSPDDE